MRSLSSARFGSVLYDFLYAIWLFLYLEPAAQGASLHSPLCVFDAFHMDDVGLLVQLARHLGRLSFIGSGALGVI